MEAGRQGDSYMCGKVQKCDHAKIFVKLVIYAKKFKVGSSISEIAFKTLLEEQNLVFHLRPVKSELSFIHPFQVACAHITFWSVLLLNEYVLLVLNVGR